jgi:thiol-disulfide isomerase/thioredoxin
VLRIVRDSRAGVDGIESGGLAMRKVAILTACVWVGGLLGGPGSAIADPEPTEILKAMNTAIAEAQTLAFTFRRQCIGSLATTTPEVTGSVAMERIDGDDLIGWRIVMAGERSAVGDTPAGEVRLGYDGDVLVSLDEAGQVAHQTSAGGLEQISDDGTLLGFNWLLRWDELISQPFGGEEALFESRYEGEVEIDGVRCYVVFVDLGNLPSAPEYDIRWFVGVEDSLPRRYDAYLYDFEGLPNGFEVMHIENLRVGDPVLAEAFSLAVPDGYEVETIEVADVGAGRREPEQPEGPAPDFTLTDTEGVEHSLKDYRGKVVVLDFGATWCGPCVQVMPQVQAIHERFADQPVQVFGVNCWETGDMAQMMKDKGYTYTMLLDGDEIVGPYGVSAIPTFYVIGVDGQILLREVGGSANMADRVGELIADHLAQQEEKPGG